MTLPKSFLLAASCLAGLLLLGLLPDAFQAQSQFKNVQVLTDLNPDQLKDYMTKITEEIGAGKCSFCHGQDKSTDENEHKVAARNFMKMTREMNAAYFKDSKSQVSCYTCHQGKKHPVNSVEEAKAQESKDK